MKQVTLVLDNVRSAHNVGSIVRSAAAFGIQEIICAGVTPYPALLNDRRLPHVASRATNQILKTSLGGEKLVKISHKSSSVEAIDYLKSSGVKVYALEQDQQSQRIDLASTLDNIALVCGAERSGLDRNILKMCDGILEIPLRGAKESLNVSVAVAVALYELSKQT